MEQELNNQTPDQNTLWLAIGIGVFSVFASFFLAIYFAAVTTHQETSAHATQTIQAASVEAAPIENAAR